MISVFSVDSVAIYHGVDISKRFPLDAGWIRHAVCAVIHRTCRQAHNKKDVVLLRNARWVTQKALIHPALRLK